jgi:hypothetical protein
MRLGHWESHRLERNVLHRVLLCKGQKLESKLARDGLFIGARTQKIYTEALPTRNDSITTSTCFVDPKAGYSLQYASSPIVPTPHLFSVGRRGIQSDTI